MKLKLLSTLAVIILCSCSNDKSTNEQSPLTNTHSNVKTESISEESENNFDTSELSDVLITLERKPCFGTCPVYKITISGDGNVTYIGSDFKARGVLTVKEVGERSIKINKEKIIEIIQEFEKVNYFSFQDEYNQKDYTDGQIIITSITINGKSKTIKRYSGDKSAPKELKNLENRIDKIINSDQWIK